jgi:tRNA-dihydrouridine synthase 2
VQDVSRVELNCGSSTRGGMGAALLTDPKKRLCAILRALRAALPPAVGVSAKIRLLAGREETLELVGRIVEAGVSAVTVHCRTRSMRERERALVERMREIVEFVEGMGRGVAVIYNGDCLGFEDARRIRELTGASFFFLSASCYSL